MTEIDRRKNELRLYYRSLRKKTAGKAELDRKIFKLLISSNLYNSANTIFTYVSLPEEIDTRALLLHSFAAGKKAAVPRCGRGGKMDFFVISGFDELETGSFGIPEPKTGAHRAVFDPNTLCIVPGLAFDRFGNRLGYGGGYYDRFLSSFTGRTVGLCYENCLCGRLEVGEHDVAVSMLVTEENIFCCEPC